jgi:BirA family biotin operon repressor/biotin-[acetyl-CoA-carboxylase] ligase
LNKREADVSTRLQRLDTQQISDFLDTQFIAQDDRFIFLPVVDSTNTLAMEMARSGSKEGVVVLTDSQRAGRGRQGRRWVDAFGCNALLSIALRPVFPPHLLVMVASLAVVDAISTLSGVEAAIKWPNDVLVRGHKIAGILIETSHDMAGKLVAVVGIGVNVNGQISDYREAGTDSPSPLPELAEKATTLEQECGHQVSRERFIARLLRQFESSYLALQQEGQIPATVAPAVSAAHAIREQWRAKLSTLGRTVQVRQGDTLLSGVAEGVNENGELFLRLHSGERISITWGDIG